MDIKISNQAQKAILKLTAQMRNRILSAIKGLELLPQKGDIKKLKGRNSEYRLRIGDYRVIYTNSDNFVYIIDVDTRNQIYK
jgi:mRNA interferase RelE/StbE